VLDGREFVGVVPFRPGDHGPGVHLGPVPAVKLGRLAPVAVVAETVGPNLRVLLPELLVRGERIDHLGPLALPFGVLVAVENLVGQVTGADDRARHDAGYLLARPGQVEDGAVERLQARSGLLVAAGRFVRLRVVEGERPGRRAA